MLLNSKIKSETNLNDKNKLENYMNKKDNKLIIKFKDWFKNKEKLFNWHRKEKKNYIKLCKNNMKQNSNKEKSKKKKIELN
jgi:hypothetical protein